MSFFKPQWMFKQTVLNLIDEQIAEGMKAHISNQGTAEHYQALANGNAVTLARLRLQRAAEIEATTLKVKHPPRPKVETAVIVTQTVKAPRLASAK